MANDLHLPAVEQWEIESTAYLALTEFERGVVDQMMASLIDIGRAKGIDLWAINPRANATKEKLAQWFADRRHMSKPGTNLTA